MKESTPRLRFKKPKTTFAPREQKFLKHLARGDRLSKSARKMCVSNKMVDKWAMDTRAKLNLADVYQLRAWAARNIGV